jgi:hypothetical protein
LSGGYNSRWNSLNTSPVADLIHRGPARTKRRFQEPFELGVGHPVAFDFQAILRVAFVIDVVWWICEHQVRCRASHQPDHVVALGRVAYQELVIAEDPKIAGFASGRLR